MKKSTTITNMTVSFENITIAQKEALEDMLATWERLGNMGSSRWTAFFADGDGNFRPKIKVDGKKPKFTERIKEEDKYRRIQRLVKPNKLNGLTSEKWMDMGNIYFMDFDAIAWAITDEE